MGKHAPIPNAERAARYRAGKRAQGLRLKQIWLPDTSDPAWRAEAARQSALIAQSDIEADDMAFIESLIDWEGMPPP